MDSQEFVKLFDQTVAKVKIKVDYEYRLYYNKDTGVPLFYTMEGQPDGDYIEITKEEYTNGRYDILIHKGGIKNLVDAVSWTKLVPSNEGISTREDNVMIVDDNGAAKWKLKTYYCD